MMRSLFSAVSGLRTHQTRMDVIGNNVANVNTPGYKSSRVTFEEVFSQTLRGASSPSGASLTERGGMNPLQVGLGVTTASIDTNHTPGNLQPTSNTSDAAIEGKGFFVVLDGMTRAYTRVGAFGTDGDGILVDAEGRKVLGWLPDAVTGQIPADRTAGSLAAIRIAIGSSMPASATGNIDMEKNLDAEAAAGATKTVPVTVYDSLGVTHTVEVTFEKTAANAWDYQIAVDGTDIAAADGGTGDIGFADDGTLTSVDGGAATDLGHFDCAVGTGAADLDVNIDFSILTQVAGSSSAEGRVDGWPTGTLESFTFDSAGIISGSYSNGETRILGQVAVANFANAGGLQKKGKSLYTESNNSGVADIGAAGTSGRGTIAPSSLEMSNVDLAEEFTQMIITQRGFQANSRVITTSDELLQELVNLKR